MKTARWMVGVGVTVGLLGKTVWAEDAARPRGPQTRDAREGREHRAEWFKQFDQDGDGKLSPEERAQAEAAFQSRMPPQMRERMLKRFDKDGDGKLSAEELQAAREAWQAEREKVGKEFRERLLKKFDTDGDGKLSPEERQRAAQVLRERRERARTEWRERMMRRFDKNGDGRLDENERREAEEAMKRLHGSRGGGDREHQTGSGPGRDEEGARKPVGPAI